MSDDQKSSPNQSAFAWLIGMATLLLLGSAWFAWQQPPHPDASHTTTTEWSDRFWYPIEHNSFKRLPVINVNLNAIFVLDQRVWVVGEKGLIVHSQDGKSWQRQTSGTQASKAYQHQLPCRRSTGLGCRLGWHDSKDH